MLCLAGLRVLDKKKIERKQNKKNVGKIKKTLKTLKKCGRNKEK